MGTVIGVPMPMFGFHITAVKATNTNGSQHHRLGVYPDIYTDSETLGDYIQIINDELSGKHD